MLAWVFGLFALAACAPAPEATSLIPVSIAVDGDVREVEAPAGSSVNDVLAQATITLEALDRVTPEAGAAILPEMEIHVVRVKEKFDAVESVIPFERQTVRNESLATGQTLLVQPGVNGLQQTTHRVLLEDGVETSNTVFKTETLKEPVPEIMMVGVQQPFAPVRIAGRLAYLAGGNAWVMEGATGDRRPVVTTGDLDGRVFALSPKGEWLLFSRAPQDAPEGQINSLWAIDLTDPKAKIIDLKTPNVVHYAGWIPGKGLAIAYSSVEPRSAAPGWQANNDLQTLSFSATGVVGKPEMILDSNSGGVYGWWGTTYAFSPSGSRLAFARPDAIGLVDLESKAVQTLVDVLPFNTRSDWAWVPGLSWSPDETVLYFANHTQRAGIEDPETSPYFELNAAPIDTPAPIQLAPQTGMFAYPVASPLSEGGRYQLAFLQAAFPEQSDTSKYRLVVMDRDGSSQQIVFPEEGLTGIEPQKVVWSPTSTEAGAERQIALLYQGNLWLITPGSSAAVQITGDGLVSRLDWR